MTPAADGRHNTVQTWPTSDGHNRHKINFRVFARLITLCPSSTSALFLWHKRTAVALARRPVCGPPRLYRALLHTQAGVVLFTQYSPFLRFVFTLPGAAPRPHHTSHFQCRSIHHTTQTHKRAYSRAPTDQSRTSPRFAAQEPDRGGTPNTPHLRLTMALHSDKIVRPGSYLSIFAKTKDKNGDSLSKADLLHR